MGKSVPFSFNNCMNGKYVVCLMTQRYGCAALVGHVKDVVRKRHFLMALMWQVDVILNKLLM